MDTVFHEELFTIIDVPDRLTPDDIEAVEARALSMISVPEVAIYIDMKKVINVYSATVRLIMRIYDRAARFDCPVVIINASDHVVSALHALNIDEKIPLFTHDIIAPEIELKCA